MVTDGMTIVGSYCFWSWWFSTHPEKEKELLPYKWPQPIQKYNEMLNGRECPFCHGNQYFHLTSPINLGDVVIKKGYCVCVVLRLMDDTHKYESDYQEAKLKTIEEYGPHANFTRMIKAEAGAFIRQPSMWQYLYGGYGSGKTHVLSAIKSHLRGLALYITASDLNQHVFKATGDHVLDELIDDIASAPVLLLDDLGTEYSTQYLYSAMYSILNRRYAKRFEAPTFITSNLTQIELLQSSDENMRRIGSRLSDTKLVNPLVSKQEDYRRREIK